ncbi:MAG: PBP1A family penicillin-binding protein [Epsilonproteobacteria bacterium]|nr:PBP1A family penicillin-binding protein [Campylobacterota bacterium]
MLKYFVTFLMLIAIAVGAFLIKVYSEIRFDAYKIINYSPPLTTRIYDRNGKLIANIFGKENRIYAKYKDIPPMVVESLVAIEDTLFFEHPGINPEAIFRAAIKDIKAMKFVEGASTLTQQLIKDTVLTRDKKIMRKIKEALLAIRVDSILSKEDIIERYLNQVYFGHGYYGIKTASLGYFHKDLDELDLKEIAMLVGLPKAPSAYNPTKHMDLSLARANMVLNRLYQLGWIDKSRYEKALTERPKVYDDTLTKNKAPYIVDEVLKRVRKKYKDLRTGGYKIYTSIDLELQQLAKEALKYGYDNIVKRDKEDENSTLNGAIVVLDNHTGKVLAMVGGVDYKKSPYNRATQAKRQPGSSIKPFIYQLALNEGYNQATKIPDISRVYKDEVNDKDWTPRNYENNFEGLITLEDALVHSRNLATINLVNMLGLKNVYTYLNSLGFKGVPYDLSISLGSFVVSPYDFAGKYTLFSNYGQMMKPLLITKIATRYGNSENFMPEGKPINEPKQAFLIVDILKQVVSRGTGRRARVKGIETAGKTGTTNNFVDAWFCGFTPDIEVITWYGHDNNTPMKKKEAGGRAAAPVFKYFVERYIKLHPETKRKFDIPKDVRQFSIKGKKYYYTDISKPPKIESSITETSNKLLF